MSSFSMNMHGVTAIRADGVHCTEGDSTPCHWLTLYFTSKPMTLDNAITIFMDDPELIDRLAAAINSATTAKPPSPAALNPTDYRE